MAALTARAEVRPVARRVEATLRPVDDERAARTGALRDEVTLIAVCTVVVVDPTAFYMFPVRLAPKPAQNLPTVLHAHAAKQVTARAPARRGKRRAIAEFIYLILCARRLCRSEAISLE